MQSSETQLKRIADAIEEILRLVKKDQEDNAARQRQRDAE
jgi:tRNA(Ser,Leu) C12 N-acetylase TAN1